MVSVLKFIHHHQIHVILFKPVINIPFSRYNIILNDKDKHVHLFIKEMKRKTSLILIKVRSIYFITTIAMEPNNELKLFTKQN